MERDDQAKLALLEEARANRHRYQLPVLLELGNCGLKGLKIFFRKLGHLGIDLLEAQGEMYPYAAPPSKDEDPNHWPRP